MTANRADRLRLALSNARTSLNRKGGEGRRSLSKLNTLRGVTHIEDKREGNLISRTGVQSRPVFDGIADSILGTEGWKPSIELESLETTSLAGIATERLRGLRERNVPAPTDIDELGEAFGLMDDGSPVWSNILNEQRGYASNSYEEMTAKAPFTPEWPPCLQISSHNTWKDWHVVAENARASIACERVIEAPGSNLNPLLITSETGGGGSHLLNATAQGMLRREDGNVHLIQLSTLIGRDSLPRGWQDAIGHAKLVAIDDIHLATGQLASELGLMIDLALNLGVQIVATANSSPSEWEANGMTQLMSTATVIAMTPPSNASLVTHLRRTSSGRALLLDDSMLARIVTHGDGSWRSVDSLFEKVALVIATGEEVLDAEDISAILEDRHLKPIDADRRIDRENIEELAGRVVGDALDHVYTTSDLSGVDLFSPLPEVEDDWEPPNIALGRMDSLHERLTSDALTPHVDTALTVDEADEFLVDRSEYLSGFDGMRVRETTAGIDNLTEEMFADMSRRHEKEAMRLAKLEEVMVELAQRSQNADVEELIDIADQLRNVEAELEGLDEYIPEGEWNIDANEVGLNELLEHEPVFSAVRPVKVLAPIEESE
jgi:chromosomal replication initiation ATPase DnaA